MDLFTKQGKNYIAVKKGNHLLKKLTSIITMDSYQSIRKYPM